MNSTHRTDCPTALPSLGKVKPLLTDTVGEVRVKARKEFEGGPSQWQQVGCSWASTGHLSAGATKGLVTKGSSVHGSGHRFLAPFGQQAQSCIFGLPQLSQSQRSFPGSQSSSPGGETMEAL